MRKQPAAVSWSSRSDGSRRAASISAVREVIAGASSRTAARIAVAVTAAVVVMSRSSPVVACLRGDHATVHARIGATTQVGPAA